MILKTNPGEWVKNKKVSIEIGHGGGDSGASHGNILEKDINLVVGLELNRQLRRHGVSVLINRTADVGFRVADFLARVRNFEPDVGISVHTNAFNGVAHGFEIFRNTNAFKATSNLLCAYIEREVKALGQVLRGVRDSPFMMSSLSCPTAYCEMGFLDNPDDYSQFSTVEGQKRFAVAYAKGILDYLGIEWADEKTNPDNAEGTPNLLYRVITGSYSKRANALEQVKKLKSKGFDGFIIEF
ncbi:MAG: N-acetylmuramoyl-L-alanine amidase [Oscillospiraceae bacterium]|nr:N-acetylmuramoyl-L-alanine amidase [Oscillospiraceae bacterium]